MVEAAVVEASDTISAPFCAPFVVEVEMVGAVAFGVTAVVIIDTAVPAPPHPLNKAPDKKNAVRISAPVRILEYSFWPRSESRSFRRIHENTAAFDASTTYCAPTRTGLAWQDAEKSVRAEWRGFIPGKKANQISAAYSPLSESLL
jgi:hypothetical protein